MAGASLNVLLPCFLDYLIHHHTLIALEHSDLALIFQ